MVPAIITILLVSAFPFVDQTQHHRRINTSHPMPKSFQPFTTMQSKNQL
jgi:hypothetical protein